LKYKKIYNRCE